ncbi:MAG: hypothetical protein HRT89_09075, partial [Lentisphaeria bacterium]|nr:hypothetical protein [Lentisphaeria bacterium]
MKQKIIILLVGIIFGGLFVFFISVKPHEKITKDKLDPKVTTVPKIKKKPVVSPKEKLEKKSTLSPQEENIYNLYQKIEKGKSDKDSLVYRKSLVKAFFKMEETESAYYEFEEFLKLSEKIYGKKNASIECLSMGDYYW